MAKAVKQMVATGTSTVCHYAQSTTGKWFRRFREKTIYGYGWTKWQEWVEPSDARPASFYETHNVRLPA
jgi:hypothetical protein